ncbi:MAG: M48 family metallopeptidase [Actinobacteria bacterium]|nr:M48 family metallopeptidase [Actinomycetota bacterium]MCL6105346.1 M48 family metallopeptidase [Actinomycetota bacterium]
MNIPYRYRSRRKSSNHLKSHTLIVDGITVEVTRKNIKNINFTVYPPDGHTHVTAPRHMSMEAISAAITERLAWIRHQQTKVTSKIQPPEYQYVSGENHYFQGKAYLLKVVERPGTPKVVISDSTTLYLFIKPQSSLLQREKALHNWYRHQLQTLLPILINKWETILSVKVQEWRVRKMRTKWGSCNFKAGRIWVNLELIKKPLPCLEYVVVHELAHLIEQSHGKGFTMIMDNVMPQWKTISKQLAEGQ